MISNFPVLMCSFRDTVAPGKEDVGGGGRGGYSSGAFCLAVTSMLAGV